jgi:preprotein translocase subunit YajC
MKINKKLFAIPTLVVGIGIALLGFSTTASAASVAAHSQHGVSGIVTAINGDTITLQHEGHVKDGNSIAPKTYNVEAANAAITKDNASSSLSDIAVDDKIRVEGTVSGTSVVATSISDGVAHHTKNRSGVHGTVTAINGTTLTVQTSAATKGTVTRPATTYTVDAGSATVRKDKSASTLSAVSVGDTVRVRGTLSGTIVAATKVSDGVMLKK